ncbi:MAG TPA: hypothetical protein VFW28_03440 [Micropepsaceae bacterium]|nr:hypothetical protein [Micropepsaceae bacterium]
MGKLEEIEKAVAALPPEQLAKFREWFDQFAGDLFDTKIERDVKAGRLEQLAERALADLRSGRAREL